MRNPSFVFALFLLLGGQVALAQTASEAEAPAVGRTTTAREDRPSVVTGLLGSPGGLGVSYTYNTSDRVAVGALVATWGPVTGGLLLDLAAYGRYHLFAWEQASIYFELDLRTLFAPAFFNVVSPLTPGLGTLIGFEWRSRSGFTAGLNFGNNLFFLLPDSVDPTLRLVPSPAGYLQFGYAW
jgi:hypothetical protein